MTWEEFKNAVEENGVKNNDVIDWIDVHAISPKQIEVSDYGKRNGNKVWTISSGF